MRTSYMGHCTPTHSKVSIQIDIILAAIATLTMIPYTLIQSFLCSCVIMEFI